MIGKISEIIIKAFNNNSNNNNNLYSVIHFYSICLISWPLILICIPLQGTSLHHFLFKQLWITNPGINNKNINPSIVCLGNDLANIRLHVFPNIDRAIRKFMYRRDSIFRQRCKLCPENMPPVNDIFN